jgi:rhamnosyltransferase subunit B
VAHVVLTTIGSRGDLHPLLALAAVLMRRGHTTAFVLEGRLAALAQEAGFPVAIMPGDPEVLQPYLHEVYGGKPGLHSLSMSFRHYIVPTLSAKVPVLTAALRGADLVVAPPVHPAAVIAADLTGTRWVSVSTTPAVPSAWIDPVSYPAWVPGPLRRQMNRILWGLSREMLRRVTDPPVNQARQQWGLAPVTDVVSPASSRALLNLVAVSKALVPRPRDWPIRVELTGFAWRGDEIQSGPDKARPGDPPVIAVVGGSTAETTGDRAVSFCQEAVRAVHAVGGRAFVVGSWADRLSELGPGDEVTATYVPYATIFSRCDAVIHHGGIGTMALALRAGIPAIVVPWAFDQAFNAVQLKRLGAGLSIPLRRFRAPAAARALRALLGGSYRAAAEAVSRELRVEDGAQAMADRIDVALAGG